jgi:hypothetical protein
MSYHIASLAPTRTQSQKRRRLSTTTESSDESDRGSVGISGWCNANGGPEHTLTDMFACLKDGARLAVKKVYCNFCGDHMGDTIRRCEDCGAYMCEQVHPDGSGCIGAGSVGENARFFCIVCDPKRWRKQSNQARQEDGRMPVSLGRWLSHCASLTARSTSLSVMGGGSVRS